jgi:hypothetical protein
MLAHANSLLILDHTKKEMKTKKEIDTRQNWIRKMCRDITISDFMPIKTLNENSLKNLEKGKFIIQNPPWNKGKKLQPLSEDHKKKISQSKTGIPLSEETKQKQSISCKKKWEDPEYRNKVLPHLFQKGHVVSEETCKKISKSKTGKKRGSPSEETRKLQSLAIKGRKFTEEEKAEKYDMRRGKNHPMYGKKHKPETIEQMSKVKIGKKPSKQTKEKMRKSAKRGKDNHMFGKKLPPERIQVLRDARAKQVFPRHDTGPEKELQALLTENSIPFEKQKLFRFSDGTSHKTDAFVEPNICLEVDGCFDHACIKCYKNRSKLLPRQLKSLSHDLSDHYKLHNIGIEIVRINLHDLKYNTESILTRINYLKSGES